MPRDKFKAKYADKSFVLQERSDVDNHAPFDPEELGMEDWGDNFFVEPEMVHIERNPDGSIKRTTPLSEVDPEVLKPKYFKNGERIDAPVQERPAPKRPQEKVVAMLAGLLMTYYARHKPGELPYNPLYDGIPTSVALADSLILQPEVRGDTLVHVSAEEVHSWLRQLIGKRAQIMNTKTGKLGWSGDIRDLVVNIR